MLLASSLVLMTLYVREGDQGAIHDVQSAFSGLMAPLKFVGGSVGSGTDAASNALANSTAQDSTLEALKSQNEQLRDQISQLEEYRQEAQRLEGLLNIQGYYSLETVAARVTDRSTNSWEMTVTIDKGSNDGIIAGLPVMASTGVVGQVISTTATSAQVRLLADPQSGVAVLIQSNRAQGIVSGSLE
ncbi:MAG: rod shape-determining protein MreC, partial [Eggerthellaceae bacterium]|nr:rod shape-determining protein MreC [Eggerthellaceae bacterium]